MQARNNPIFNKKNTWKIMTVIFLKFEFHQKEPEKVILV